MVALTGSLKRPSKNPLMAHHRPQPLLGWQDKTKTGFHFNVKRWYALYSGGTSTKKPLFEPKLELNLLRDGKACSKTGFQFNVKKWSAPDSDVTPPKRKPPFETKFDSCQDGRKSSGHAYGSFTDSMKKWSHLRCAALYYFIDVIIIRCIGWYSSPFSGCTLRLL